MHFIKSNRLTFLRLLFLLLLIPVLVQAQVKNSFEFAPIVRFDKYPRFAYVLGGRPSTDFVDIKGLGWGFDFVYKTSVSKRWSLRTGLGYYKYAFNKIEKQNTSFGISTARNIQYPSPLYISFFTDKYWYHTLDVTIGLERELNFKNGLQLRLGGDLKSYFTYSQYYHLNNNPGGTLDYGKKDFKYFATSVVAKIDLIKKIGKQVSLGPSIMLPVFDIWRTDYTFQEETGKESRSKFSMGIGVGLSLNYYLN